MPETTERVIHQAQLPTQDGFDLTAYVVEDDDFDPRKENWDSSLADQIAAWERDEWRGVGTIVEASRGGVVLGDASIWGSVYGTVDGAHVEPLSEDGTDHTGYLPELIDEALTAARAKLAEIR